MLAQHATAPRVKDSDIPIETLRAIAVLLLVTYHAIGAGPNGGLQVDYPHRLRIFADFFSDVRMPLFAFIAGFVYALRPPQVGTFRRFVTGKLRRLFVPGIIAATAFFLAALMLDNRFAQPMSEVWRPIVYSYAHFWFLQSILVIFAVFGLIDAVLSKRFTVALLLVSCAIYISGFTFGTRIFSVNGALYLLPYFLLGVVAWRHGKGLFRTKLGLSMLFLVCVAVSLAWAISVLRVDGTLPLERRDVQSLLFGLSICGLLLFWCPRIPDLERLSPFAFTIYLYHVFGTVAARMITEGMNTDIVELRLLIVVAGGLALPILLHLVVQRMPVLGQLVVGKASARTSVRKSGSLSGGAGPLPEPELVRDSA